MLNDSTCLFSFTSHSAIPIVAAPPSFSVAASKLCISSFSQWNGLRTCFDASDEKLLCKFLLPAGLLIIIIIIIIIIALQHGEDMDRMKYEQKLVLNEDEN